MFYFQLRTAAF